MENTKKRIVIVTSIHPDFDSRIWKHASSLAKAGLPVALVCPWSVGDREIRDGVEFFPFEKVSRRMLRPLLIPYRIFRQLRRLRKETRLIHFHDFDLVPFMTMYALRKDVVYDVHENYAEEMLVREWIPKPLRRPLFHLANLITWVSGRIIKNIVLVTPSQEEDFQGRSINRIYVKNYATTALKERVLHNHREREPAVIYTGSQYPNNGSLVLIDIAEQLKQRKPECKIIAFDRFGSADFREKFFSEIERRGLTDQFIIHKNVLPHELIDVLNTATIAINPNLRVPQQIKCISTKLFEYMAAGLPLMLSDLAYHVNLVKETNAGLVARPEDPVEFADKIIQLVEDQDYARQLGDNAMIWFDKKYNYERQIERLIEFYDSINSSHPI